MILCIRCTSLRTIMISLGIEMGIVSHSGGALPHNRWSEASQTDQSLQWCSSAQTTSVRT
jgi:hypothetical protein